MRQRFIPILLSVALVSVGTASSPAAVTESQPPIQVAPPLQAGPQPPKPPKFTPEQEAALIEVRKILLEARQVAARYILPRRLTTSPALLSGLERRKAQLLDEIEKAQLRAGDLAGMTETKRLDLLALAQARYGDINGAVQTAARNNVTGDQLLVLVDFLIKAATPPVAILAAESNLAKDRVDIWRRRDQAAVYALIARRQYQAGDPEASITLQKAIKAVPGPKHTPERYLALLHVARAQAILVDRASSDERFWQAIETALTQQELSEKVEALRIIAKAQAESGNIFASEKTFQQAIKVINSALPPRLFNLGCIAWSQVVSGNRAAGIQTFQQAIRHAQEVQMAKRGQVLWDIGAWQVKVQDYQGAHETIQLMIRGADSLTDGKAKSTVIAAAANLAAHSGDPQLAIDLARAVSNDWERAAVLESIVRTLVKTRNPLATPEVFSQLAKIASMILMNPTPMEKSQTDTVRSSVAVVQAAGGDVSLALRTADSVGFLSTRIRTYGKAASLLTAKGDFDSAKEVIRLMNEEWHALSESEDAVRKLARARVIAGDETQIVAWARQQESVYARAQALLGVAVGLMERHNIEDIERATPEIPLIDQCPLTMESPM